MAKLDINNPLFKEPVEAPKEEAVKRSKGRPKNPEISHESGVQQGLTDDYTRATFIIRKDLLNDFRDYAFTEYMGYTEAINKLLEEKLTEVKADYEKQGKTFVPHPKRGKK